MIAKAAVLIQQLNSLITNLESHEDEELDGLKKQLSAANRAISMLQTNDLSIPQDLTKTQEKLKADVLDRDEVSVVLTYLKGELENILADVQRLDKQQRSTQTTAMRPMQRRGTRTSKGHYTSEDTLRGTLVASLKSLGGSAPKSEVEDEMERRLRSVLTNADYEPVGEGIPRWKKNAQWMRYNLVQEGIMKSNSPRGIWELK